MPSPCSKRTTSNASRPTPAIDKGVRQAENWLADQIEGQLWTA
ncbi:hypothetical protein HKT54_31300, partial [Pseudomonas aeruginosa]|nr:hypothetical protein [Pseudomonas aeruginosa]